jgi:CTD kinase subunit gamma
MIFKASLNMRINLLYFLDSICEASAQSLSNEKAKATSTATPGLFYVHLLEKDLETIVQYAVPESRDGLMNVQSTMQASRHIS